MTVKVMGLEFTFTSESFLTLFTLKWLLLLEEQEPNEIKSLDLEASEEHNRYRVRDEMLSQRSFSSKALATLVAFEFPLLAIE